MLLATTYPYSRSLFHSYCVMCNVCSMYIVHVSHGQQIESIDCVVVYKGSFNHLLLFSPVQFSTSRLDFFLQRSIHIFLAILLNYSKIYESLVCAFIDALVCYIVCVCVCLRCLLNSLENRSVCVCVCASGNRVKEAEMKVKEKSVERTFITVHN